MELYGLTDRGRMAAGSTGGVTDRNNPEFYKWAILYKLRLIHFGSRDKLAEQIGCTPTQVSLALRALSRGGYVQSYGNDKE